MRIRILFGFEKSPEYEYHYSVSTIQISFDYRIICSPMYGGEPEGAYGGDGGGAYGGEAYGGEADYELM